MSNIIIPDKHFINAIKDSGEIGQKSLVDWTGKPVSAKDYQEAERTKKRKYSIPIGADYRYYKINVNDKVYVGYVKNRRIPKGATSVSAQTAFEIMYGYKVANEGTNAGQWKQVNGKQTGSVIVEDNQNRALPNVNAPEFENITKTQEIYHD